MDNLEARLFACESENIALQSLVAGLLTGIAKTAPPLAEGAFAHADLLLEAATMKLGKAGYPPDAQSPLKVLDQLRTAVLGPPKGPSG